MLTNIPALSRRFHLQPLAAAVTCVLALAEPALAGAASASSRVVDLSVGRLSRSASSLPLFAEQKPHATAVPATRVSPSLVTSLGVTSCGDDDNDPNTLRFAVLSANSGDLIDLSSLACSKITLQHGGIVVAVPDLEIKGPGANALAIDGNQADRVFLHGGPGTLTLTDITVQNGAVNADKAYGGCIYTKGNLQLTRAAVRSCKALGQTLAIGGGAVVVGTAVLDSSVLSDNVADAAVGKGSGQESAMAGGLFAGSPGAETQILHSLVSGNTVHAATGAAEVGGLAAFHLKVKYSTVSGNKAIGAGDLYSPSAAGGLASLYSLTMQGSTVDHNEAEVGGGIVVGANSGYATIIQSTISSNKGTIAVGGIEAGAPISFANSTVAFNTGGPLGGGGVLAFDMVSVSMQGTIIANNAPTDLDGGVTATGSNNLVKIAGVNATVPMGTITLDPKLAPLAANGGPTRTHALGAGSPAMNAGNNVLSLDVDQRGTYYPRLVGAAADIGAFEADPDHVFGDDFGAE